MGQPRDRAKRTDCVYVFSAQRPGSDRRAPRSQKHRNLPEIDRIFIEVWLIQHVVRSDMLIDAREVPVRAS